MRKTIICTLLFLAVSAVAGFAQDRLAVNYTPGREQLAEDTFKQLVEISSSYDQLNMAADLTMCQKAIEDYPDLRTALLENFIFDYCNVHDSLKTSENRGVNELDGKKFYAARHKPEWDELGRKYTQMRLEIENRKR